MIVQQSVMHRCFRTCVLTPALLVIAFHVVWQPCVALDSEKSGDDVPTDSLILPMEILEACSQGTIEVLRSALERHPQWVNGRSPQGESCLHLAGIMGQTEVTRLVLDRGGDPNIRTTFEKGQRMHPLSWNVYGGHVDTARVLLEHGADVNLDVDWMRGRHQQYDVATPLDLLLDILPTTTDDATTAQRKTTTDRPELDRFFRMKDLLLEFGAMTYSDLQSASEL